MRTKLWLMGLLLASTVGLWPHAAQAQDAIVGLPADLINAYPMPNVRPLAVNTQAVNDRAYRRVLEGRVLTIHDAPGGQVIATRPAGYNYVTLNRTEGAWTEINAGQWVLTDTLSGAVGPSQFAGVMLPDDTLPYPMAWLLINLYPSTAPGGRPAESNGLRYRYTRVNIYSTTTVDDFAWYQIGVNQWVHQHHVAQLLPVERDATVDTHKWISVDLYEQVLVAYEGNVPVFGTLIASGLPRWPTNEGTFHVYWRKPRDDMSGGRPGDDFYHLEEVPWSMFFDGGIALHGTYWHDNFGYRQSHGCVNLSITDAAWLWQWASDEFDWTVEGDVGPAVVVYSSGTYR